MKMAPKKDAVEVGANIPILGNRCRCGYEWKSRKADVVPTVCPKCKTPYWRTLPKRKRKDSAKS